MEVGQCAFVLIAFAACVLGVFTLVAGNILLTHLWNKPPSPPSPPDQQGPISRALSRMIEEAHRLGITMHRVAAVCCCSLVMSLVGWGGVSAYNNVKIVDCGKGDIALKLPDPAKRVIVAAGIPCPCGCGCEK